MTATVSQPAATEADAPGTPHASPARQRLRFLRGGKTLTGLALLGFFVVLAVVGPWLAPYDPDAMSDAILQPPSADHWLGTTQTGQDVLSQILVGTRGVLVVGFLAGLIATVLSVLIGVSAGFLGGVGDELLSALSNIFLVIPGLPLIIIVASFVADTSDLFIAAVIALTSWAWGARVLRAQTLSLRGRDYVQAARATGEPTWRLICCEVLPNLTAVIASGFVGTVIFAVLSEITLAFIGVADISNWNWGTVLFWAQSNQALAQGAWWWFVPAGLCIALLGTALALINFGIDEFVNPRLRVAPGASRTVRMRVGFTPVARRPAARATAPAARPERADDPVEHSPHDKEHPA
ncbi:ABC transporter permease [Streptomyces sp. TRM 70351]|uniref:ABC transporter permease n=1 Tax=Streptomyces sp. TRM 70351 TaxID=3116552 RepID=UPI002E7ACDBB|nr:ABC transporter permease [Streptomyces sp. TRM 70351]MEE1927112.1 ABC transporter permease [Streptomyces sp. TRM 70351]